MLEFLIILLLAMLAFSVFFVVFIIIDDIFDYKISDFICKLITKTKSYKTHKINEEYKKHLSNLKYKNDVVELPFSVVQPLLHNDSPIIYRADKEELMLAKDKYSYNKIYIKLSKKDYKEYYNYLIQKEENKKHIEQTENTLKATKLIQAELNRINEETLKRIETEKEKINHLTSNLSNSTKRTRQNTYNHAAQTTARSVGGYYTNQLGQKFWIDEEGNFWLTTEN